MDQFFKPDRRTVLKAVTASAATALIPFSTGTATPSTKDRELPAIGLGSWITFNVGSDKTGLANSQNVIAAFFEAGGRTIDSSPMYGSSQNTIGQAVKLLQPGSQLFAADKVWVRNSRQGLPQIATSLANWQISKFDLLQVHNLLSWEEHLETLFALKTSGELDNVGVTTSHGRRHSELERIMTTQPVDFIQLTYNLDNREAEARLLPLALERGIKVIANRPYDGGRLIRRLKGHTLPGWCGALGITNWAEFALGYIISNPALAMAIPATTSVDHVVENMGATRLTSLDAGDRQRILNHFADL